MRDIRDFAEKCIVEENQLFNSRITKFIKVVKQRDIRDLRNVCKFYKHYQKIYMNYI